MSARVFISHSSHDATLAHDLVAALEAVGVACWISGRDVSPGANYQEAIVGAIAGARAMVLLLTEAANASDEVKKELSLASAQGIAVYPVRLGSVQPNAALRYELATRQWIDGGDVAVLAARLAAAIHGTVPQLPSPDASAPLALPDKPSLVVLPFQNMSGDPEQEYFVDGLVEDITTALSRIPGLFVIARNSAFTYKGRAVDIRQVGRDLGVRYALEGSVRKVGGKVRITGQLIEAANGAHLWADRFDGALDDIFELQDQVTSSVAGAIEPSLQRAEIERAQQKPTADLGAYDYFLRGMAIYHQGQSDSVRDAMALFTQAFSADPTFGAAYGMAARCISQLKSFGLVVSGSPEAAEGVRLARLAALHGRDDATALACAGAALAYVGSEAEAGLHLIEQACALNSNSALAFTRAGLANVIAGNHEAAIASIERAMRLSPRDPESTSFGLGMSNAHYCLGRYDEARSWAEWARRERPQYPPAVFLAAISNAMSGRLDAARDALDLLARLRPAERASDLMPIVRTYARQQDRDIIMEGLRRAGMPE